MGDKYLIAAVVLAVIIVGVAGLVLLGMEPPTPLPVIELTITASGVTEEVSWGQPEHGFWGEENGAIDWRQMPHSKTWLYYDAQDEGKYTFEYWFRERYHNGTQWEYENHGPFFVNFPQLEYHREIELNNHTVYIDMSEI